MIDFATSLRATPIPEPSDGRVRQCGRSARLALRYGLIGLLPAVLLVACGPRQEVVVEPPLPKPRKGQPATAGGGASPPLAPLATPQQVVRSVDVGRRDPFAAVLLPRPLIDLANPPRTSTPGASAQGNRGPSKGGPKAGKPAPTPSLPKGLVLQGLLQGPAGQEALVQYTPAEGRVGGARSGSLRVGDVGTAGSESLLPPGWRVRAIDMVRERLVLQADPKHVFTLEL